MIGWVAFSFALLSLAVSLGTLWGLYSLLSGRDLTVRWERAGPPLPGPNDAPTEGQPPADYDDGPGR